MNKRDFLAGIRSEMKGKSLEAHWAGMAALAAFIVSEERSDALQSLREAISRTIPEKKPARAGGTFLEAVRKLLEQSEEGEFVFEYVYESRGYWDDDDDYCLVDCNSLAQEFEPLLDEALAFIKEGQFETGLTALDMLAEVEGYVEGDIIDYQTLIEQGLIQNDAELIHKHYAVAALMVLRELARTDKLLQIAQISGYELPIGEIIELLGDREIDLDAFFEEWPQAIMREIERLETSHSGLYYVRSLGDMLVAAVRLQGEAKMAEYAHEYGRTHPILYCALVESMIANGNCGDVIKTADVALSVVESKQYRVRLADLKHDAGKTTGDTVVMGCAALQGFAASLSLKHFLRLWEYGDDAIRAKATEVFRASMDECRDAVPILFIMGAYKELWDMVKVDKRPLGWSTSKKGQAFPLFIALLAERRPLPECTRRGIERKIGGDEERVGFIEIVNSTSPSLSPDDRKLYHDWCVNEIESRVEGIVRNQHRGSYDRAALLVMSMAETIAATKGVQAARSYINDYKANYPRHRAFLAEMNGLEEMFYFGNVIEGSKL
jgi:hypothetical protein